MDRGPSVRVRPDIYERGKEAIDPRGSPRMRPRQDDGRRYASGRGGQPHLDEQGNWDDRPPQRKPSHRRSGFHEQLTDVLRTEDVHRVVEQYYQQMGAEPDEWASLDGERYRPSKPGQAQLPADRRLAPGGRGAHYDRRDRPMDFKPVDRIQLTNVLDIHRDRPRLDHNVVGLDPDAMPQQLREHQRRAPAVPPVQGYSHHDPAKARAPSPPPQDNDWDDIDAAQRGYREFNIDNSPRYFPDEEE